MVANQMETYVPNLLFLTSNTPYARFTNPLMTNDNTNPATKTVDCKSRLDMKEQYRITSANNKQTLQINATREENDSDSIIEDNAEQFNGLLPAGNRQLAIGNRQKKDY